jgi:hypothetical protein
LPLWSRDRQAAVPVACPIERQDTGTQGHSWDLGCDGDLLERWSSGSSRSLPSRRFKSGHPDQLTGHLRSSRVASDRRRCWCPNIRRQYRPKPTCTTSPRKTPTVPGGWGWTRSTRPERPVTAAAALVPGPARWAGACSPARRAARPAAAGACGKSVAKQSGKQPPGDGSKLPPGAVSWRAAGSADGGRKRSTLHPNSLLRATSRCQQPGETAKAPGRQGALGVLTDCPGKRG